MGKLNTYREALSKCRYQTERTIVASNDIKNGSGEFSLPFIDRRNVNLRGNIHTPEGKDIMIEYLMSKINYINNTLQEAQQKAEENRRK